jgi:hypothetical protein
MMKKKEVRKMATIKTADLIAKFQYALNNNWGYILNTWHT